MDIEQIKERLVEKRMEYRQRVAAAEEAKNKMQEYLDNITAEDEKILRECVGINFDEIRGIDMERCCKDAEYRDKCVELQNKFLREIRKYLEKELWG